MTLRHDKTRPPRPKIGPWINDQKQGATTVADEQKNAPTAANLAESLRMMTAGRDAALAEMNAWSQIDDARNQRDRARTELTLQALSERDAARADVERLLDALKEIRGRIKNHPAYEELTLDEEIEVGGDTAELSYLARVADEAISAAEVGAA